MDTDEELAASVSTSWADYDGDGDLDLLVTGPDCPVLYQNDGGTWNEVLTGLPCVSSGRAVWGDYDRDGRIDVLMAGGNLVDDTFGIAVYRNENVEAPPNQPPAPPIPISSSMLSDGRVRLEWEPAWDEETTLEGLSYNVRVGNTSGDSAVLSPLAVAETGARKVVHVGNAGSNTYLELRNLPPGEYNWAVQAIDSLFTGSAFSSSTTFVVPQKGDVNGDGAVDIIDALMVAQADAGITTLDYPSVADVNDDGLVDNVDAMLIARYSVGLVEF
jgi:hypothetical protein